MTTRTVAQIENATNERVGPFKIKNILPTRNLRQVDPFLLIHHMQPFVLQPGMDARVPPHPHAGFEVVTYLLEGEFFHKDSQGHDQVASGGDVNWMTSGRGIIHSEGPTETFLQQGGTVQLLQLWINLPADKKQLMPSFRHYAGGSMPVIENEKIRMKLVIGEYEGKLSPIQTHTSMFVYHVKIKNGAPVTIPVNENYSAAVYVMQGKLKVLNEEVKNGQLAAFNIDGNQLAFSAAAETELLILGGEPIKEKVVNYGPFVMNSLEEIQEAIHDYETGKMGALEY